MRMTIDTSGWMRFHARVNQGFRDIADAAPDRCVLIAGDDSEHEVHTAIMRALRQRLALPDPRRAD